MTPQHATVSSARKIFQASVATGLDQGLLAAFGDERLLPTKASSLQAERAVAAIAGVAFPLARVKIARKLLLADFLAAPRLLGAFCLFGFVSARALPGAALAARRTAVVTDFLAFMNFTRQKFLTFLVARPRLLRTSDRFDLRLLALASRVNDLRAIWVRPGMAEQEAPVTASRFERLVANFTARVWNQERLRQRFSFPPAITFVMPRDLVRLVAEATLRAVPGDWNFLPRNENSRIAVIAGRLVLVENPLLVHRVVRPFLNAQQVIAAEALVAAPDFRLRRHLPNALKL